MPVAGTEPHGAGAAGPTLSRDLLRAGFGLALLLCWDVSGPDLTLIAPFGSAQGSWHVAQARDRPPSARAPPFTTPPPVGQGVKS